jgi:hypothetical protein
MTTILLTLLSEIGPPGYIALGGVIVPRLGEGVKIKMTMLTSAQGAGRR